MKPKNISKLQYITQDLEEISHVNLVEDACKIGVDWIQLRLKNHTKEEVSDIAQQVNVICKHFGAKLIINDQVDVAMAVGAQGVHLGKQDMPVSEARKILGENYIIGGTANTFEDILILAKQGVDYIGLGPYKHTFTKTNLSPVLGVQAYKDILKKCYEANINIPVVAVGGIKLEDMPILIKSGVHGIAVASCIGKAENKGKTVNAIQRILSNPVKDQHATIIHS